MWGSVYWAYSWRMQYAFTDWNIQRPSECQTPNQINKGIWVETTSIAQSQKGMRWSLHNMVPQWKGHCAFSNESQIPDPLSPLPGHCLSTTSFCICHDSQFTSLLEQEVYYFQMLGRLYFKTQAIYFLKKGRRKNNPKWQAMGNSICVETNGVV